MRPTGRRPARPKPAPTGSTDVGRRHEGEGWSGVERSRERRAPVRRPAQAPRRRPRPRRRNAALPEVPPRSRLATVRGARNGRRAKTAGPGVVGKRPASPRPHSDRPGRCPARPDRRARAAPSDRGQGGRSARGGGGREHPLPRGAAAGSAGRVRARAAGGAPRPAPRDPRADRGAACRRAARGRSAAPRRAGRRRP